MWRPAAKLPAEEEGSTTKNQKRNVLKTVIMKLTKEQRNLVIAMAIGDGHVARSGYITIQHSTKQKDYLYYKYSLLKRLFPLNFEESVNKHGYPYVRITSRTSDFLRLLRRVLYPDNKKTINRKLLNRLGPAELAIWWMDDGTKGTKYNKDRSRIKGCVYRLCLCTSREQCQIVIDWLYEKFQIKFGITKEKNNYSITCGTREGLKLSNLIGPYIIPSMLYKVSYGLLQQEVESSDSKWKTLAKRDEDIVCSTSKEVAVNNGVSLTNLPEHKV